MKASEASKLQKFKKIETQEIQIQKNCLFVGLSVCSKKFQKSNLQKNMSCFFVK